MKLLKDQIDGLYRRLLRWNNPYYDFGVPSSGYQRANGTIWFPKLNFGGDERFVQPVLRGYPYVLRISEAGGVFSMSGNDLLLDISRVRFRINSPEELFILYEVFLLKTYRFYGSQNSVFVDIGMNAGISTIFFASDPRVRKVFSFELFRPTYELGIYNLNLNPALLSKVKAHCFGLSDKSFETTLDYSLSRKGRMGLNGLPGDETFPDVSREPVEVRDIGEEFKHILAESSGQDVIVKIDCEGEEYVLIDQLAKKGMLGSITAIMLEWHHKRPASIEERLLESGFYVFSSVFPDMVSGMVYASRKRV